MLRLDAVLRLTDAEDHSQCISIHLGPIIKPTKNVLIRPEGKMLPESPSHW
jgi:hypothetical protein